MASKEDKSLAGGGISRRDFLNGMSVLAVTLPFTGFSVIAKATNSTVTNPYYPPTLTGLRGSHKGSFEVAHKLAREKKSWERPAVQTDDIYDLIVVGGGISGLSSAYFYQKKIGKKCKVLILDNHDDFGGHAKRNEFHHDGEVYLGSGGSEMPSASYPSTQELLKDLGVDIPKLASYRSMSLFKEAGTGQGLYLDKATYGTATLAVSKEPIDSEYDRHFMNGWMTILRTEGADDFLASLPLSDKSREDLRRLMTEKIDYLKELSTEEKIAYLKKTSYLDFLKKNVKVEHEVADLMMAMSEPVAGVDFDAASAHFALLFGFPGFEAMELMPRHKGKKNGKDDVVPSMPMFPDGNASIARLLVHNMIPDVTSAKISTMESIPSAEFDYSKLDLPQNECRIRLNSTVVNVQESSNGEVDVTYVKRDTENAVRVRGRKVVVAAYHMIIPYLMPQLPERQKKSMASQVKVPVMFVNVLLKNWQAWQKLGIDNVHYPQGYFKGYSLEPTIKMGGYGNSTNTDSPILIKMRKCPCAPYSGLSKKEQHIKGRYELLTTSFSDIENNIRKELTDILGPGGFDADRDILAITVNRWSHGYSYVFDELHEPYIAPEHREEVIARKRFGNISIANNDANAYPTMNTAIDQAHRAATELLESELFTKRLHR